MRDRHYSTEHKNKVSGTTLHCLAGVDKAQMTSSTHRIPLQSVISCCVVLSQDVFSSASAQGSCDVFTEKQLRCKLNSSLCHHQGIRRYGVLRLDVDVFRCNTGHCDRVFRLILGPSMFSQNTKPTMILDYLKHHTFRMCLNSIVREIAFARMYSSLVIQKSRIFKINLISKISGIGIVKKKF